MSTREHLAIGQFAGIQLELFAPVCACKIPPRSSLAIRLFGFLQFSVPILNSEVHTVSKFVDSLCSLE